MNNPIEAQSEVIIPIERPIAEEKSRRWRVGTLSMGLSLLLLGALTMLSQWKGADVFVTTLAWWPLIFILLGLEIVIYTLWFRGKGIMHYDVVSVLFVGFLAVCCLIFAAISSLGLTQEIRRVVSSTEASYSLPTWKATIPKEVNTIIVQASATYGIKVDRTTGNELNVFGKYFSVEGQLKQEQEKALLQTNQVGNTLYVVLGDIPRHLVFDNSRNGMDVTIAAPVKLKVIVRDAYGNVVTR